jgi:hypothetical protein
LVASAPGRTLVEVQADSRRLVAAASPETPAETAARHRRLQRFWHGYDADGMGIGGWRVPPAEQARLVARHEAELNAVFDEKRDAGERESVEVYAADAFLRMFERTAAAPAPAPAPENGDGVAGAPPSDAGSDDWSFAKVIVKIDLTALDRGFVEPGEMSEIVGQGPIPVRDVWRMIDGDAFIAAVATKGTEISKVVHLGRRPTVLQRTALEALGDGTCQIDGCNSKARLEIDHVTDWAATKRTELDQLARVCGHHHDLKTHHGHRFGPLEPDGTRQLIPPAAAGRPPATARPPELTLHHAQPPPGPVPRGDDSPPIECAPASEPSSATTPAPTTTTSVEARARAIADRARKQGALFDTG